MCPLRFIGWASFAKFRRIQQQKLPAVRAVIAFVAPGFRGG
jgi:hypothetical protein